MQVQKTIFMLMAQDMGRAIAFYNETIGLDVKVNYGGWAELGGEDAVVALHAGGDGEYRSTGLGFTVADVAAACEEVSAAGGRVVQAPVERGGEGIILAFAADTEGNGFSLTQSVQ